MAAPIPARPDRTRWGLVAILCLIGIIAAFQMGKVPPALPLLREEMGIGLATAGLVISAFNLLAALTGVTIGLFADRIGYRRTLVIGLGGCALGSTAGAAALWFGPGAILWLLFARLVEGVGFLAVVTAAPALIAHVTRPRDRGAAMGGWGAYFPTGMAVMILASTLLLPRIGWQGVWLASAAVSLVAAAAAWAALASLGRTRGSQAAGTGRRQQILTVLRARGPVTCAVTFGCYSLQWLTIMGFLPLWLIGDLGLAPGTAALVTAIAVSANIVGNLAAGPARRGGLSPSQAVVLGAVAMGICGAAVYQDWLPTWARFAALLAFSGIGGLIPANLFAMTAATVPSPGLLGSANGLVVQVSNLGQLFGPPVVGWLVGVTGGWSIAPAFLGTAALLCLVGGITLRSLEAQPAAAESQG